MTSRSPLGLVLWVTPTAFDPVSPSDASVTTGMFVGGLIAFYLAIGGYHLAFYLRRREAPENLYFAVLCLLAALYGLGLAPGFSSEAHLHPYRLGLMIGFAGGPVYLGLIARLFDLPLGRAGRIAALASAFAVPVVALVPAWVLDETHHQIGIVIVTALLASVVWAVYLGNWRLSRTRPLLAGLVAFSFSLVWDLLSHLGWVPTAQVVPGVAGLLWAGFFCLVVAVGMETASSFARAEVNARTDPLTGLIRRHMLEEALSREAERRRRSGGVLTLVAMDLDHFKRINDTYGHRAGDAVLERVGHLLRHTARNIDLTARLGGEEFGALLFDTDAEGALAFVARFRLRLAAMQIPVPGGVVTGLTASVGVAVGTGWVGARALLDAADEAMYEAKRGGRDRVVSVSLENAGRPPAASA